MEYIHKEKQTIISEAFYNALKKGEKDKYQPYYGEDADDGTKATSDEERNLDLISSLDLHDDELDEEEDYIDEEDENQDYD